MMVFVYAGKEESVNVESSMDVEHVVDVVLFCCIFAM
jgi:hypothetical protein